MTMNDQQPPTNPQERELQVMLAEARRTLSERRTGYETLVGKNKMEPTVAQERIMAMEQICKVVEMNMLTARNMGSGADLVSYTGEVMLSNWSETAAAGRKVEFWLPEGADAPAEHPFKYYSRRLRGSPGAIFQMVLVEVNDEGEAVPRGGNELKPGVTAGGVLIGGAISQHAGRLSRDSDFHEYLGYLEHDDPVEQAAKYIRGICAIDTRKLLDHDREAQLAYENKVVSPFNQWLAAEGGREL
jgi:hypothetical protein